MTDKSESRNMQPPTTAKIQTGTVKNRKTMHFYQNSQLTSVIAAQGKRHILRAQDTPMALLDQTLSTLLLKIDEANTVLGLRLDSMMYSPYGHLGVDNPTVLLGFTGQQYDLLTQGYLLGNGHRLFKPSLMRLCSPDTFSPFDKGGVNTYAYCLNDPINRVDPSGNISAFLRRLTKGVGNFLRLRTPSSGPGGNLSIITEPAVRDMIFNQLSGKDLGNLASTSKEFHLEIGALSIKNAKRTDANSIPKAVQGKFNGVLPIDAKLRRDLQKSVTQQISSLPITRFEVSEAYDGIHPGTGYLRLRRNVQRMDGYFRRAGIHAIDPITGRRNAVRLDY